jgi:hypothetical protein
MHDVIYIFFWKCVVSTDFGVIRHPAFWSLLHKTMKLKKNRVLKPSFQFSFVIEARNNPDL